MSGSEKPIPRLLIVVIAAGDDRYTFILYGVDKSMRIVDTS